MVVSGIPRQLLRRIIMTGLAQRNTQHQHSEVVVVQSLYNQRVTKSARCFHAGLVFCQDKKEIVKTSAFDRIEDKTKDNYLAAVRQFYVRDVHRRGHVEFIYAALKKMEDFGVHRDLEAYKKLLDVFPKGKFIPQNVFQVEFMHYPKQQQCAIDLLEQMENNGVIPDWEMETQLRNIFGKSGYPCRKFARMMYWMPKFKNLSPWPLPDKLPNSSLELAKLAIERICSVDPATEMDVFETKEVNDSVDDTWVVSGQSVTQRELISQLPLDKAVYVEGAFRIWLRKTSINYFILRADMPTPTPEELEKQKEWDPDDVSQLRAWIMGDDPAALMEKPKDLSVHEQEDGIILGVCVTGTSSKDSLLSWIRLLEKKNPKLGQLPVLFSTQSPLGDAVIALEDGTQQKQELSQITAGTETCADAHVQSKNL